MENLNEYTPLQITEFKWGSVEWSPQYSNEIMILIRDKLDCTAEAECCRDFLLREKPIICGTTLGEMVDDIIREWRKYVRE